MIEFAEKKKKLSQVQRLAKELAKRPLTGMQIIKELGILNYKGRVCDLRRETWYKSPLADCPSKRMIKIKSGATIAQYHIHRLDKSLYKKFLRDFLK